jgi:hypothetical protein
MIQLGYNYHLYNFLTVLRILKNLPMIAMTENVLVQDNLHFIFKFA